MTTPPLSPFRMLLTVLVAAALFAVACGDDATADDCDDATCTAPPAAICDGDALLRWDDVGACVNEECAYEVQSVPCAGGCADGACIGGEQVGAPESNGSGDGSGA